MKLENIVLGFDASKYNVLDPSLFPPSLRFGILRLSYGLTIDAMAITHARILKKAGVQIIGGYHWSDPIIEDDAAQLATFDRAIFAVETAIDMSIPSVWVDIEQYWASWAEYSAYILKGTPITKILSPSRISSQGLFMTSEIARKYPMKVVGVYTRRSFVLERAKPMLLWLPRYPQWLAQWPYKKGRVAISWDDLIHSNLPTADWATTIEGSPPSRLWQFSGDKFYLPGSLNTLGKPMTWDLDAFAGTMDELDAWLSLEEAPPHEPVELKPVRCLASKLFLRGAPSKLAVVRGEIYRDAELPTPVELLEADVKVWLRFSGNLWACMSEAGVSFLEWVR